MLLDWPESQDGYRASVRMYETLVAEQPRRVDLLWHLAASKKYLAMNHTRAREMVEAERVHSEVVKLEREMVAREPGVEFYANALKADLLNWGRILTDGGRAADAEKAYLEALRLAPDDPLAMNNLAWLLAFDAEGAAHEPARAVGLARKAVAAKPKEANYWNTLGLALVCSGDLAGALEALETSMKLGSGGGPHDWFLMALVHARRGDSSKAAPLYQKGLAGLAERPADRELPRLRDEVAKALGVPIKPPVPAQPKTTKARPMLAAPPVARPSGPVPDDAPRIPEVRPPARLNLVRPRSRVFNPE